MRATDGTSRQSPRRSCAPSSSYASPIMYQSLDIVRKRGEANTLGSAIRIPANGLIYGHECHILEVSVPRATVVLREKHIDVTGNIVELVVWRVAVTLHDASGIRYRLAFVRRDEE